MAASATALSELLRRPDLWRGNALAQGTGEGVPSGFAELDGVLPGGGWPRGALTELLCRDAGVGELSLLLPTLAALDEAAGWIALVAPPWQIHAPAWHRAGVPLDRLLVIEAKGADAPWACEQLLASGALAALLTWLPQADGRTLRRLQLAAQGRRSLAFVFRPETAAAAASPAPLRLALAAGEHALAVNILKRRGPPLPRPLQLAVARPIPWSRLTPRSLPVPAARPLPQPALLT